jgi:hypothetical protein
MAEATVSEASDEELEFRLDGDSHWEAGKSITARRMARSLPRLVGRSLRLVWRVDRRSVIGLLSCQVISGTSQGFGLLATTGTITALISSGDITHRLWSAWPSVAVMVAAAGVRAVLSIVVTWLSRRRARDPPTDKRRHRRSHRRPRPRPHCPAGHLRRTRRGAGIVQRAVATAKRPQHLRAARVEAATRCAMSAEDAH